MCSYCGGRNIPMIAKLNAEHDAIVNSSDALEIAFRDQDAEAARMACKKLGGLLHPHTRRAQFGLFAEMEKDELFTEHVASLCAEHDQLDADLEAIVVGDLTRIPTMIALLNNHIDREENGLFPAAPAYLDDTQWDVIQRPDLMNGPEDGHPDPHPQRPAHTRTLQRQRGAAGSAATRPDQPFATWAAHRSGPKTSYRICDGGTPLSSSVDLTCRMNGSGPQVNTCTSSGSGICERSIKPCRER